MTLRPVAVLIVLSLLSGCAVEKTISTEVPKRLSLTWDRSDWRICDQRECPAPTSKTVLLVAGDSILVEGRTDDLGSQAFNDRLARKRAEVVAAYLMRLGVRSPIDIRSQGKCCYAIANNSDESRAINRRVDLHFSSTQKE